MDFVATKFNRNIVDDRNGDHYLLVANRAVDAESTYQFNARISSGSNSFTE